MICCFKHEVGVNEKHLLDSIPPIPKDLVDRIESLSVSLVDADAVPQNQLFSSVAYRAVYCFLDVPCAPAVGWLFCSPPGLPFDELNTVTAVYFGHRALLLCDFE